MDFYTVLSQYYNELFPAKKTTVDFVRQYTDSRSKLLDIGCGTGALSHELTDDIALIRAIDLDSSMIEQAKENAVINEEFAVANMLNIDELYNDDEFDLITCFGNTLAHLQTREELLSVLASMFDLLKSGGRLLIQVVNFDRVENHVELHLPLLESESVVFKRIYKSNLMSKKTKFWSEIQLKVGGVFENEVTLYTLKKDELVKLLLEVGFGDVTIYGDFKKGVWSIESGPIIAVASK